MNYPGSLHNHTQMSNFRIRDCIIKEEDLINKAIELNHSVIAVTDHETIASAVRVEKIYNKIKEKNIPLKVIIGNEIYLCRDGLNNENYVAGEDKYYHFILLAKDLQGYQQICELSTRAWMRSYVSRGLRRVPTYYQDIVEIIGKKPGHVIGSSACLGGMLATQLLKYRDTQEQDNVLWNKILNWCQLMCNTFGGKDYFYLELQPSASKEQTYVNRKLIEISNLLNIDYIITTDSHYLQKEDKNIHKAFLHAQDGDREVDSFYATTYLMNTEELESHLDLTREELDRAYSNITKIQNLCEDYSILKPLKIPSLKWNDYGNIFLTQEWIDKIPMLETFNNSSFDGDKELVKAIIVGINKHEDLQNQEAYNEINSNLQMTWVSSNVNKAHWSAYYLNLQKIIDLCWEADSIVGPGRGSGVGFILLYCLGITQINPLREETKTYSWRFLNPERVSVLDIDFDIEGSKRAQVLSKFREFYGEDRVSNVTTFRTEKTKSAILTAARGLDIDNDEAQYLASLIPADRGQLRSLSEVYYGNPEKDFKPVTAFVQAMDTDYQELWQVAQKIEGLICGTGIHAGGVIFVDEPFTLSTGLMRAPDGTICTQFDLHDAEAASLIKYDALSVEAMDKLHVCLDLICNYGYETREATLRETYEKIIGIYKLDRTSEDMWKMVWEHKILSLFQMEQQSGIQGIALAKPKSVNDLSVLNSVIRLMAPDKNSDTPLVTWSRYRKNINLWLKEMRDYGLSQEEIDWLSSHSAITDGICESQEGLMSLVQEPRLGGNTLTFADKCRKGIAKKQGKLFQECEDIFYENIKKNNCSEKLAHYVWDVLLKVQRGYSFNRSHCLAYSLVALQEMNLAYKYPIIFWSCACLISNSGSLEDNGTTDYAKTAKALGDIISRGIKVTLVDINKSNFSFEPDVENNQILFGLKALSGINTDVINKIIVGRPCKSFIDFLNRCPLNKTAMVSLIKAGSFDNLEKEWAKELNIEPRVLVMIYYILKVSEPKKRLTLQNFNGLMQRNLVPEDLTFTKRVYIFNDYLKKNKKVGKYYVFDEACDRFYSQFFNMELLQVINGYTCILQSDWEKIYQKEMDAARAWLTNNQDSVLKEFNYLLFKETWDKYAEGTISAWEMEALCFYYHEHELININTYRYGVTDFFNLPEEPQVDYFFKRNGKEIPIYKLYKIIGTVISKDDAKSSVTILTTRGVVTVKFTKEYYAMYNRRISEIEADGSKKVKEEGWFKRGTKIMVTGFRRENQFVAKTYQKTESHQLYKIVQVNNDTMILEHNRYGQGE
jgi:DNA polymerase-3 subunit alpha